MTNPFDATDAQFLALRNHEGQFSLWPVFAPVPEGWSVKFGPEARDKCLAYIEETWTDIRPLSALAGAQ